MQATDVRSARLNRVDNAITIFQVMGSWKPNQIPSNIDSRVGRVRRCFTGKHGAKLQGCVAVYDRAVVALINQPAHSIRLAGFAVRRSVSRLQTVLFLKINGVG